MLYLDDRFPTHPKFLKAGARLGPDGHARALTLYLACLAYARGNLTDGYIPDEFVSSCGVVQAPQAVAKVLSSRAIKLWHRERGGYRIHDFLDWNKSAKEIKEIREGWRTKKADQRRDGNGRYSGVSPRESPRDSSRDSRARTRSPNPKYKGPGVLVPYGLNRDITAAGAAGFATKKNPTHRILCAMVSAEIDLAPDGAYSDWVEGVKLRLAHQGFSYPDGDAIATAFMSVEKARTKKGAA